MVTPYLFIGRVGITWFEILLVTAFAFELIRKGAIPKQPIILIYALLLLVGYFIALINADINFNIDAKFGDLKILYWLLLAILGAHFGYSHYQSIWEVGQSRPFKLVIVILGCFIGSYPFLSNEIRELVMRNYYHPDIDSGALGRIYVARFPGLGVNANTFAFMMLISYYISVKSAFEKKISWIYPLASMVSIVILGSKTNFILALLLTANIFYFSTISSKIKIKTLASFAIFLSTAMFFFFLTNIGRELQDNIVLINRLMSLTEARSEYEFDPIENRLTHWKMGMERVGLAPFAGIAISSNSDDSLPVNFCCPHNEFIAFWTFTGILGLLAYIILICGLIIKNKRSPNGYFWIGLYFALFIQMFFDSVFQSTRFLPIMFVMIGLNLRELDTYRQLKNILRTNFKPQMTNLLK
jgi:hypothetical protein